MESSIINVKLNFPVHFLLAIKTQLFFPQGIAALAKKHQTGGNPQPVSLITMHTPEGLEVTEEELFLRGRVIQLGDEQRVDLGCVDAILDIMRILKSEGVENMKFEREDGKRIGVQLSTFLDHREDVNVDLILYHILIWKTAGDGMWTIQRNHNERTTIAYVPVFLETSAMEMSAEICARGSHLLVPEREVSSEVKALLSRSNGDWQEEDWQEISVLEFVNATLPGHKARGPTSQPVIPIVVAKDRNLSWRSALDSDNHNGETIFENVNNQLYVRTAGDLRILFENRPDRMNRMVLGELVSHYRLLKQSGCGYEKAKNSINEDTSIGPESGDLVAGTCDTVAPQTMMLKNGQLMKRRHGRHAVPNLLYSGCSSKHGNELMWTSWRQLEDVTGEQDEEETENQRGVRLELFPLSVFPIVKEDSGDADL